MRWPFLVALLAFLYKTTPLSAQTAADLGKAAELVTAQGVARHIGVMTGDSMVQRSTPSRGLDLTAEYVAKEFAALGLKPGGRNGEFIERYPVPLPLDVARSRLALSSSGKEVSLNLATSATRLGASVMPEQATTTGGVVLVAGKHTLASLDTVNARNKTVLYVMPSRYDPDEHEMLVHQLTSAGRGVLILSSQDSASFTAQRGSSPTNIRLGQRWVVYLRSSAVADLNGFLASNGVDLSRLQSDTTPVVRDIPSMRVSLDPKFEKTPNDSTMAPNVVALLEGSDPKLKAEYIVYSAHMDRDVGRRGQADSLRRGADDNASGVAALLELAKAYSQPGARPKRSMAFLATSGSAQGGWGSNVFADRVSMSRSFSRLFGGFAGVFMVSSASTGKQSSGQIGVKGTEMKLEISGGKLEITPGSNSEVVIGSTDMVKPKSDSASRPAAETGKVKLQPVGKSTQSAPSINNAIVNINLDMIGRGPRDSITIDGLRDLGLPTSPAWIAAAHPELRLTVVEGGTAAKPTSDHLAFIQQGIPSLFIHNGAHDSRPKTDLPANLNAEQTARIVQLAFYLGYDIANAAQAPRWTQEGRRHYLNSLRK